MCCVMLEHKVSVAINQSQRQSKSRKETIRITQCKAKAVWSCFVKPIQLSHEQKHAVKCEGMIKQSPQSALALCAQLNGLLSHMRGTTCMHHDIPALTTAVSKI